MKNASDEDASEGNQPAAIIDEGNTSNISGSSLITFRIEVEKGALAAEPSQGSSYFEWSIVMDPIDIDGPEEQEDQVDNEAEFSDDEEGNVPDVIDDVEENGRALDEAETFHHSLSINSPQSPSNVHFKLPEPGPLKGYEYTEFKPIPLKENSLVDVYMYPTQSQASAALTDLQNILHRPRDTGGGYKVTEFDLWRRARLEGMISMLNMFTNPNSLT
jgi:hypothetical protein